MNLEKNITLKTYWLILGNGCTSRDELCSQIQLKPHQEKVNIIYKIKTKTPLCIYEVSHPQESWENREYPGITSENATIAYYIQTYK